MKKFPHTLLLGFFKRNLKQNDLTKIKNFVSKHELLSANTTAFQTAKSYRVPADYALEFGTIEAIELMIKEDMAFNFWGVDPDTGRRSINAILVPMKLGRDAFVQHLLENHFDKIMFTKAERETNVSLLDYLETANLERFVPLVKKSYAKSLRAKASEFRKEALKLSEKIEQFETHAHKLAPDLKHTPKNPIQIPPKKLS